ncbi:MAG: hypothetical protein EPO68_03665 [Planctomycetota bacterium]|nr:MAG: hypothetical protein EPO68_03665 [Planctomycetota bacterium]
MPHHSNSFRLLLVSSFVALAWSARSIAQETVTTSGPIEALWQSRYDLALPKNERAAALRSHNGRLYSLALSTSAQSDPLFVVTATDGATQQIVWQSSCVGPTYAFGEPVGDIEVAPDGSRVYVASSRDPNIPEAVVSVFDGASGMLLAVWQHGTPLLGFQRARVSADGARLYAIGMSPVFAASGVICCFSTSSGQVLWSQSMPLGINSIAPDLELSLDGQRVFGSTEHGVEARATASGALLWSRAGLTRDLALQPVQGVVARAHHLGVELLNEITGAVLVSIPLSVASARAVAFEPGGTDFAVARSTSVSSGELARYAQPAVKLWSQAIPAPTSPSRLQWSGGAGGAPAMLWLASSGPGAASVRAHAATSGALLGNQTFPANGGVPALALGPLDGHAAIAYTQPGEHTDARVSVQAPAPPLTWSQSIGFEAPAAEEALGAAVTADGALLVASAASAGAQRLVLRRIDAATGAEQWRTDWPSLDMAPQLAPPAPATGSRRFALSSNGARAALAAWKKDLAVVVFANAHSGVHELGSGLTLQLKWAVHDIVAIPGSATAFAIVAATNSEIGTHLIDANGAVYFSGFELDAYYDPEHPPRIEPTPDGTRVLVANTRMRGGDLDIALKFRDTADGALVWGVDLDHPAPTEPLEFQQLNALAIAPDGARAFVVAHLPNAPLGAPRQTLTALDLATGAPLWSIEFDAAHGYSHALAMRPDGAQLALADRPESYGAAASVRAFSTLAGQLEWATPIGQSGSGAHRLRYDATGTKVIVGLSTPPAQMFPLPQAGHGVRAFGASNGTAVWSFDVETSDDHPELVNALVEVPSPRRLFAVGSNAVNGAPTDVFVRALDVPELTQNVDQLSVAAGGTLAFELDAGPAFAGDLAWLAGSASGTAPGLTLDGLLLPLVPDAYFLFFVTAPNLGYLHGTLGALDAFGHRTASIVMPGGGDPAIAGLVLHHAYAVVDLAAAQVVLASDALAVTLVP